MSKYYLITILPFLLVFILLGNVTKIQAQVEASPEIATMVKIQDQDVADGAIICSTPNGFTLCNESASTSMFGVVDDNPVAVIDDSSLGDRHSVLTKGIAQVRVSNANGLIRKGSLITTSTTAGVGQLATENGYVLGIAQSDYQATDSTTVGLVPVILNIHLEAGLSTARSNLIAVLRNSTQSPVFAPLDSLRYLLAAVLVVLSFIMGFLYFGRTSAIGVEAIGRNPLARRQIQVSVIFHFVVTFVVIGFGLVSAYLILIL